MDKWIKEMGGLRLTTRFFLHNFLSIHRPLFNLIFKGAPVGKYCCLVSLLTPQLLYPEGKLRIYENRLSSR